MQASPHLKIGFVRRGYSSSGGAESYLKRLAAGVVAAGHAAHLFTTSEWPPDQWPFGSISTIEGRRPLQFADNFERLRARESCDLIMSLERVWSCDVYRAGDGVHRAWLARRAELASPLRRVAHALNRKHLGTLRLEQSLLGRRAARRVIANSEMVQREITEHYGYPPEQIDVVRNGVPVELFRSTAEQRAQSRSALGLNPDDSAVLFVGSGWERKGLRFAIDAVEACADRSMRLLLAGRGNERAFPSAFVQFLGVTRELPALYGAADIFLLPTIYDPFSNATLEAIAAGLPIITTAANGASEIITNGINGSIIQRPNDISAIRHALLHWSSRERRETARPLLLPLAQSYDISVNVARTLEILLQSAASASSTDEKIRNT